jgi:hypothetical protein
LLTVNRKSLKIWATQKARKHHPSNSPVLAKNAKAFFMATDESIAVKKSRVKN